MIAKPSAAQKSSSRTSAIQRRQGKGSVDEQDRQ
jgi:hypothetical protein